MDFNEDTICRMLSSEASRRRAFDMVVKAYSERLYWKIRCFVFSHEDANDVLQNTFVKAWSNIASFQNRSKLYTWLCSIAINESLDFIRKNKTFSNSGTTDDVNIARNLMADEYFDGDEAQALLMQAVATLPEVQRTVFTLRYFDNMKYKDMSKILNTSEGALKASYHIAVKKIADYFHLHE